MTNPHRFFHDLTAEADALEQQTPLSEENDDPAAPEPSAVEADEADLSEQAVPVPAADEDDYDR